jgi:hypothetical protein
MTIRQNSFDSKDSRPLRSWRLLLKCRQSAFPGNPTLWKLRKPVLPLSEMRSTADITTRKKIPAGCHSPAGCLQHPALLFVGKLIVNHEAARGKVGCNSHICCPGQLINFMESSYFFKYVLTSGKYDYLTHEETEAEHTVHPRLAQPDCIRWQTISPNMKQ